MLNYAHLKYLWCEAVTYRETHPHEYLLLKDVEEEDKHLVPLFF